ncbi:MAG TPA: hypothetical protein PK812_00890, partial [Beijerinckiaceae bacterium]|nr:hypothetical protein [Beijerinckiaceae bacterium]
VRFTAELIMLAGRGGPLPWRAPLACLARDIVTLALWLPAWRTRQVRWGGRGHYPQGRFSASQRNGEVR